MITPETKFTITLKNIIAGVIFIWGLFYTIRGVFRVTDNYDKMESRIEEMSKDITDLKVTTEKMKESIDYLKKEAGSK